MRTSSSSAGAMNALRHRICSQRAHPKTRTFGFVEDIHRFIAGSDLVLTKPGALSTYEALACGVPVLLLGLRGLMPQESGLFHAAAHYEFGFAASRFSEVEDVIQPGTASLESNAQLPRCVLSRSATAKRSSKEFSTSMPRHSLVTGVTGFVGSHLAYRLLEDGHHVTALARGGKNVSARERVLEVLSAGRRVCRDEL